jgi:aldehyde:ferredoxin oxidoreductase
MFLMTKQRKFCGWVGKILKVDLSSGKITKEPLDKKLAHDYIGGRGINDVILYKETGPETDPLGSGNVLLFGAGPLAGTPVMESSRLQVTAKSPITGILGLSNVGGEFAPELKFAGYDHIVIYGKAAKPVYLVILDDSVELKDAAHLWGKTTIEAARMIKEEVGEPRLQTAVIGPGGENLVRFANIMVNPPWGAAGRTGMGAVMGSKNLKAIAVKGTQSVHIAGSYKEFIETNKKWIGETKKDLTFENWKYRGTSELVSPTAVEVSWIAIKNHRIHDWDIEKVKELWYENWMPKYLTRHKGCMAAQYCCSGAISVAEGPFKGLVCKKPEGGGCMSLGAGLDISYPPAVFKETNLLDEYGIDTHSGGQVLAVAGEWYEKGIITKKDTGGLELNWGDYDAFIELIRKIAYREDIGDVLAEGSVRAAEIVGAPMETVPNVKGQEQHGGYEHYPNAAMCLAYAVSPIGWDHKMGTPFPAELGGGWLPEDHPMFQLLKPYKVWDAVPEKADAQIWMERITTMTDCLGFCKLACAWYYNVPIELPALCEFLNVVTGIDYSVSDLEKIADKIWTLERAYIVREGIRRKDDRIPERMNRPVNKGPLHGKFIDKKQWESLLDAYYEKKGWDKETAIPTEQTLESFGLKDVADDLKKRGIYKEITRVPEKNPKSRKGKNK